MVGIRRCSRGPWDSSRQVYQEVGVRVREVQFGLGGGVVTGGVIETIGGGGSKNGEQCG